jgi:hypothetical protein
MDAVRSRAFARGCVSVCVPRATDAARHDVVRVPLVVTGLALGPR